MKRYLPLLLLAVASCTPQQRLDRLTRQHPDLFQSATAEDVRVTVVERWDTIRLSGITFDSTFLLDQRDRVSIDTLRISEQGVTTLVYITQRDTLTEYEVVTQIDSFESVVIVRDTIREIDRVVTHYNMRKPLAYARWAIILLLLMTIGMYLNTAIRKSKRQW